MKSSIRTLAATTVALAALAPSALRAQGSALPAGTPAPAKAAAPAAPAVKLPAAREVLDRYVTAIGGRAQILKHSSRRVTGTLQVPAAGLTGTMTAATAKPNKMAVTVSIAGLGDMRQGYDGAVGWSMDPTQGPMVLTGKQLEQRKTQADFYNDLHESKSYSSMETVDVVDFGGGRAYKVQLVRASGDSLYELFDTQSGLLVGSITKQESPMGLMTITTTIGDYKAFGGVQLPTKVTQTFATGQQVVVTIDGVEFDAVEPSTFDLPTEIKALATGGK